MTGNSRNLRLVSQGAICAVDAPGDRDTERQILCPVLDERLQSGGILWTGDGFAAFDSAGRQVESDRGDGLFRTADDAQMAIFGVGPDAA